MITREFDTILGNLDSLGEGGYWYCSFKWIG